MNARFAFSLGGGKRVRWLWKAPNELGAAEFCCEMPHRSSAIIMIAVAFGELDVGKRRATNVLLHLIFHKNPRQVVAKNATLHFKEAASSCFSGSYLWKFV
jgi:hypothetical protein